MTPHRPCLVLLLAAMLAVSQAASTKFLQGETGTEESNADMFTDTVQSNDMDAEDDMEADSEDAETDLATDDDEAESEDATADDDASDDEEGSQTDIADNEAEWRKENDKFVQQATLQQQAEAQEEAEESSKIEAQLSEARSQLSSTELLHSKPVSLKANDVTVTRGSNQEWKKDVQLDDEGADSGKHTKTDDEGSNADQEAEVKDSADEDSEAEDDAAHDAGESDDNTAEDDEDAEKPKGSLVAKATVPVASDVATPIKNAKKVKGAFLQTVDDEDESGDSSEEAEGESSEEDGGSSNDDEGGSEDAGSEAEESSNAEDDESEASEDESIHEDSQATEDEEDSEAENHLSKRSHGKHEVHLASQGILSEEESNNLVSSAESDIGLNQLVEMDGTDSEAEAIRKMATARNKDEALEMEMNKNSEGDANGEYEGLDSEEF